jgi:hypothetical protein
LYWRYLQLYLEFNFYERLGLNERLIVEQLIVHQVAFLCFVHNRLLCEMS